MPWGLLLSVSSGQALEGIAGDFTGGSRLTCPRQRPIGPGPDVRYPASYPHTFRGRTRPCGMRFPVAFRLPTFASWTPCPAGTSAPITVGLPPLEPPWLGRRPLDVPAGSAP